LHESSPCMCCIVSSTGVVGASSPLARVHDDEPSFLSSTGGNAEGTAAQVEIDALHVLCAIRGTPMAKRYRDIVKVVTGPADRPAR
jgi:hypothetical protein